MTMMKMSDVFPDANAFFTRCRTLLLTTTTLLLLLSERNEHGVARREKESPRHRLEEEEAKLLESLFQQRERECRRHHHREEEDSRKRRRGAVTVRARNLDERRFSPLLKTASRFRRSTHDARVREKTRDAVVDAKSAREGEKLGREQKRRKGVDIVLGRDTNRGEG
jgi:hypothetical protein